MFDFDQENRIIADTVDIGADEIELTPNPADFDLNWLVDLRDLAIFSEDWLKKGDDIITDINGDGQVDLLDWAEFARYWLWRAIWLEP